MLNSNNHRSNIGGFLFFIDDVSHLVDEDRVSSLVDDVHYFRHSSLLAKKGSKVN
jgi:hypothetical protein